MPKTTVTSDDEGFIYLKIEGAHADFGAILRRIKESVPFYHRRFLPEARAWRFSPEGIESVRLLVADLATFTHLENLTTIELEDPYAVLCVVRTAPLDVIQAAYNALVTKQDQEADHNDEKVDRLTAAFETIKRLRSPLA